MQAAFTDYVAGAALATDLVNTSPGVVARDRLTTVGELAAVLKGHELDAPGPLSVDDVAATRTLRTRLQSVFTIEDEDEVAGHLSRLLSEVPVTVTLAAHAKNRREWRAVPPDETPVTARVQLLTSMSLLGVVRGLGRGRFRSCVSPTCSGLFVDTTRGGRRRYCMPAVCGNRAHVAAYRSRRRG